MSNIICLFKKKKVKKNSEQLLLAVWLVRINDYGTSILLLDTFGNSTIEISLRIKLPDDLIIRYCFLEVFLKIKFCKTLHARALFLCVHG